MEFHSRRDVWFRYFSVIGIFLIGMCFFHLPMYEWDFSYFLGDLGDGRFNAYILEHSYRYISGEIDAYWDAPFMYPESRVIAYSDNLLGTAPFYWIMRAIGLNVYSSVQGWCVLLCMFNFFSAFFVMWRITRSYQAAVLGAFVFAFSLSLQSQMTHVQTFPRFMIPVVLYSIWRLSETWKSKYVLLSLVSWIYLFYCGIYLAMMVVIPMFYFLARGIYLRSELFSQQLKKREWWMISIPSVVASVLFLLPLVLKYVDDSYAKYADHAQVMDSIPNWRSYLYAQPGSLLWDKLSTWAQADYRAYWDHMIFPGLMVWISIGVTLYFFFQHFNSKKSRKGVQGVKSLRSWTVIGLLTFLTYLRIGEFSVYELWMQLPGFRSMRSMTRIMNIQLFFWGLAVGFLYTKIFRLTPRRFQFLAFPIIFILLGFDNYYDLNRSYRTEKRVAIEREVKLAARMNQCPDHAIISYEPEILEEPYFFYQLDAMRASQTSANIVVNAYTGNSPSSYTAYWFEPNEKNRIKWLLAEDRKIDSLYIVDFRNIHLTSWPQ